jgi:hypothetical protein
MVLMGIAKDYLTTPKDATRTAPAASITISVAGPAVAVRRG